MTLRRKPTVVTICIIVGLLHFVTGPNCYGPFGPFVTGYLIDILLPFSLVLLIGMGFGRLPILRRPEIRGGLVFLIGATVELLQHLGYPLLGSTFDPLDILMYALGAILGLIFERAFFRSDLKDIVA